MARELASHLRLKVDVAMGNLQRWQRGDALVTQQVLELWRGIRLRICD